MKNKLNWFQKIMLSIDLWLEARNKEHSLRILEATAELLKKEKEIALLIRQIKHIQSKKTES